MQDAFAEIDQKTQRFTLDMIELCRDGEVEVLLSTPDGCRNTFQRDKLGFPRIAVALQYNQQNVCII